MPAVDSLLVGKPGRPAARRLGTHGPVLIFRRWRSRTGGQVMAGGWTRDGAVQEQIDDTVTDAVLRARASLRAAEGAMDCD